MEKFLFGKVSTPWSQKRSKIEKDEDALKDDEDDVEHLTKKRRPAWEDDDDEKIKWDTNLLMFPSLDHASILLSIRFRVKDVVANYKKAKGKHGQKETSNENYSEFLRKKFTSLVDTPKWADLDRDRDEGDDSDDEFFRVK